MTELFAAVIAKSDQRIEEVVASGADLNALNEFGRTALMEAALDGCESIVERLLHAGVNASISDCNGFTALHFAAQEYQLKIARLLVRYGAKVDAVDKYGNTPLWRATFASRGKGEMIKLLLELGADRGLENSSGVSPFDLAQTIGNYDARRFFGGA